jgi:uncharacterized protein YndB with AHSA1/START domain
MKGFCGPAAALALVALVAAPLPAAAKLIDQTDGGFTTAHSARVAATPDDVWKMLRMPQKWWSGEHSWSGNAENFWMDTQAGGCFCEKLPGGPDTLGSVQHARILFAKPGELLRLSGALGPLQGEAVTGTMTIQIKAAEGGSLIRFDYVVGGYMRFKVGDIAPVVDRVIGQQVAGLAKALGGALPMAGEGEGDAKPPAGDDLADTAKALEEDAKKEETSPEG